MGGHGRWRRWRVIHERLPKRRPARYVRCFYILTCWSIWALSRRVAGFSRQISFRAKRLRKATFSLVTVASLRHGTGHSVAYENTLPGLEASRTRSWRGCQNASPSNRIVLTTELSAWTLRQLNSHTTVPGLSSFLTRGTISANALRYPPVILNPAREHSAACLQLFGVVCEYPIRAMSSLRRQ
jgi:hypothetical protein